MNFGNARISVIIPTYNRASSVNKAIESVLVQSYQDYEIIVVDDGSTDETRDILKPFRERIRYIYQENKGVSAARNTGIQKAKGEWIAFLDSDDEWLSNKLEMQMKHVQEHPKMCLHVANLLLTDFHEVEKDFFSRKGFDKAVGKFLLIDRPLIYMLRYNFALPSSVIAKKSALINAGLFDEELSLHEDTDLFYRVSLEGQWGIYGFPLARKFRRDEPATINLSDRHARDQAYHYKIVVKMLERLQSMEGITKTERRAVTRSLSHFYFQVGLALKAEGKKEVRSWFYRGLRTRPSLKILVKWLIFNLLSMRQG